MCAYESIDVNKSKKWMKKQNDLKYFKKEECNVEEVYKSA